MSDQLRFKFKLHGGARPRLALEAVLPGRGIIGVLGESGSGKTTLLRCLAGLERAEGELYLGDECWQSAKTFKPSHKRSLAYVFQEASLLPHLSAAKNIHYGLKRAAKSVEPASYDAVIKLMGIQACLGRRPDQLSGGERQRVAMARALLVEPSLLLMDEPLAALDEARRQEILPYLLALKEKRQTPTFYVSHSIAELTRLADYLLVLDKGCLLTSGPITEVLAQLDSPLAVGEEAGVLIEAHVQAKFARWGLIRVAFAGGQIMLAGGGESLGARVRLRLLAKDISLAKSECADSSILNRLPAEVLELAPADSGAMVLVKLKIGEELALARISRYSQDHLGIQVGDQLWAQIKTAAILR